MSDNLRQLHIVETELLREAIRIFQENGISYYVIGGTLLGAVRHGGFIPWDDDIDIAVPRDDYKRLIQVMQTYQDPIVGMHYYRSEPSLYYYPVRLYHKGYSIHDSRDKDQESNPWIDILPIDGLPNSKIKQLVFKGKMWYNRFLLGLHYADNLRNIERSGLQKIIIRIAQITKVGKLINPTRIKDRIDRILTKNTIADCNVIGTCMGAYFFHEFVPKELFGKGTNVVFEDLQVRAPEKIDPYLTHMYGDYMQLPPVEKRVVHLEYDIKKRGNNENDRS